ncbi:MAG: PD-(D/E)XK nuclease family protein [Bacilli bacterium]|nr:PD-(D/E)XK nuclease family protein [Bacilli bacterium]
MERRKTYENSLIIAPRTRQGELLEYRKEYPETDFTLIDKENFLKWNCYRYDHRAEIYLLKKGYSLEAVREILNAFSYFIEGKDYNDPKLAELVPTFNELIGLGYLYKDFMPSRLFEHRHIVIDSYQSTSRIAKALDGVANLDTCLCYFSSSKEKKKVYHFPSLIAECHDLCLHIASLLYNGVDAEDIYIANYSSTYHYCLSLFSNMYGFSIAFPSSIPLYNTPLGRSFLSLYEDNLDLEAIKERLSEGFAADLDLGKIILLAKTYLIPGLDKKTQLALYRDLLLATSRSEEAIKPAVRILKENYAKQNSHVFYLDFSLESTPKTPRNPAYFSLDSLRELGLGDPVESIKEEKEELKGLFSQREVEWIGFHDSHYGEVSHISPLLGEFKMELIDPEEPRIEYSSLYMKLRGQAMMDKKEQYGRDNPYLDAYYDDSFVHYENDFSLSDKKKAFLYPRAYSPSRLEEYFKCPFAYYLGSVLRLPIEESGFNVKVGNICHDALYLAYTNPGLDIDEAYGEAVKKEEEQKPFSEKEKALLYVIGIDLRNMYGVFKEKESHILNIEVHCEKSLGSEISGVYVKGKADKIILFGREHEFVSLIDYKTYGKEFKPEDIDVGLEIQLPIYSILVKCDSTYSKSVLAGAYISRLIYSKSQRAKEGSDKYATDLRLDGIMLDDIQPIDEFGELGKGSYTKIPSKKEDETGKKRGLLTLAEIKDIEEKTLGKIMEAHTLIHDNAFKVHPLKRYEKRNEVDGCEYCSYRSVCFVKNHQFNVLKNHLGQEFENSDEEMGGEDNG